MVATPPPQPQVPTAAPDPAPLPPDEPEPGFIPVLKNRNFLALWSGQVFSQLADKVYLVLMIALIASRFQLEDQPISGWVSAVMIAFTIPAVLFGSVAGALVDRWPKKSGVSCNQSAPGIPGAVIALPPMAVSGLGNHRWGSRGFLLHPLDYLFSLYADPSFLRRQNRRSSPLWSSGGICCPPTPSTPRP
ncbi:hypothetical protein [Neosynechococcus sphagnicola]|uniref:hypothetical protein n=1 Tax=Neosynechococcus sphagnicola TaxID=1501145 RepID=UPI000AAB9200